jgi:hypothetical protein
MMLALVIYPDRAALFPAENVIPQRFSLLDSSDGTYWAKCPLTECRWENGEAILPDLPEPKIGHHEDIRWIRELRWQATIPEKQDVERFERGPYMFLERLTAHGLPAGFQFPSEVDKYAEAFEECIAKPAIEQLIAEALVLPDVLEGIRYKVLTGLGIPDDMIPPELDERTKRFLGQPNKGGGINVR